MAQAFEKGPSPTDALRKATDELAKAMRMGSKKEEVAALLQIAQALLDKDGPQAALTALAEPLNNSKKNGYAEFERKALHLMVDAHIEQGGAKQALEVASGLLELAEKSGDRLEVAAATRTKARAQLLGNSVENALEDLSSALSIFRERGDLKEQAATLLLLAETHDLRGEHEEAERKAKAALSLFKEANCWTGAGAALEALVQLYNSNGQYKAAKQAIKDELDVFTGRDTSAEAVALRLRPLPHIGSGDFAEALQLAEEGMKRLVTLGDRGAEASLTITMATIYANMGQGDDAIAVTKRALSLVRRMGSREGEKAALRLLTQIHDAKGMDPPSSPYRAESLGHVYAAANAAQERNSETFVEAVTRLGKLSGFFTKSDVLAAVGPLGQEGLTEFFQQQAPSEFVDYVLESAAPKRIDEDGEEVEQKHPVRFKESDKLAMYGSLRIGNLVYGPRFRQIEAFFPYTGAGFVVVHALVRPSSLCDDWEQDGWDWNPAVIDAAIHAGFSLSQVEA